MLNWSSHLHSGACVERGIFGIYLGVVSAHFVVDAGLWRLRDEFPRAFLTERPPFLLRPAHRTPDSAGARDQLSVPSSAA